METRRLIAPARFPLSLLQAKQRRRMESDEDLDDDLIQDAIQTMVTDAEGHLMRSIVRQTWNGYPIKWPCEPCIILPFGNNSVSSVKYYDPDNVESTFTDYTVDPGTDPVGGAYAQAGRIWLNEDADWPSGDLRYRWPIKIEFTAGWPVGDPWVKDTLYAAAVVVVPTVSNDLAYESGGGTSHATIEPTWPLETGATVVDGTVTWTCLGLTVPAAVRNIINIDVSTDYGYPDELLPGNHPNKHVLPYRRNRVWTWRIFEEATP